MKFYMTVTKNSSDQDVFRLKLNEDKAIDITLTENEGAEELKDMFTALLEYLMDDDVTIEFFKTPDYENSMYEEVCKEYITVLNSELTSGREKIVLEGLNVKPSE